jgi:hypothetical protein
VIWFLFEFGWIRTWCPESKEKKGAAHSTQEFRKVLRSRRREVLRLWSTAKAWRYVSHDVMEDVVLPVARRRQRLFASHALKCDADVS